MVDKVTNISHWKKTDKVGDPEIRNGWKPQLKWSDKESLFLCNGKDRPFRTFEKIINSQQIKNEQDSVREKQVEELIIKQAPRSLQAELAKKIQEEKLKEQSMMIGQKPNKSDKKSVAGMNDININNSNPLSPN